MSKKILVILALAALLLAVAGTRAPRVAAQGPSPESRIAALLQNDGFSMLTAGTLLDAAGNEDPTHVFVTMPYAPNAPNVKFYSSSNAPGALWDAYYAHTILGYRALRPVFPAATNMTVIIIDGSFSLTFTTDTTTFDASELSGASQAVFKSNQLNTVFFVNLATGVMTRPGQTTSGGSNTLPGNPTPRPTYLPPTTSTPVTADISKPCYYFSRTASAGDVLFYFRNQYKDHDMTFTIGGSPWGTHDYKAPGDLTWYYIEIPPGDYTWTADVVGIGGVGSGPRTSYAAGWCYSEDFGG